jgi:hypothetical protein
MFRALFRRSFPRAAATTQSGARSSLRMRETAPPAERPWSVRLGDWLGASGWRVSTVERPPSFAERARSETLAAARLDFADALWDIRTESAAELLDRIAITRSLHELWHFRGEVFGQVSCRHDQAEAARRLAAIDRHFHKRPLRARDSAGVNGASGVNAVNGADRADSAKTAPLV